jgi:hypothetical protein
MYHCAWPTWLMDVTWPKVMWPRRGSLGRVGWAHAQVAQYPPQWGLFTGSDVIKRHPTPSGFPWKGGVRACATRSYEISDRTSPVGHPLELEVTWSEVPLGCSLGRPRPITLSFSRPFTGYVPLSRHFIFMGSAFNNYISYKSLLFSDIFEIVV